MSEQLTLFLTGHVIVGLIGVMLFFGVAIWLFMRKTPARLTRWAALVGFLAIFDTWFSGGYYYLTYYGSKVKPIIKAGDYAWVHAIAMETKEHIYLFLPFVSFVIASALWLFRDDINEFSSLRKALGACALAVFLIGSIVALLGILVSGAAIKQ